MGKSSGTKQIFVENNGLGELKAKPQKWICFSFKEEIDTALFFLHGPKSQPHAKNLHNVVFHNYSVESKLWTMDIFCYCFFFFYINSSILIIQLFPLSSCLILDLSNQQHSLIRAPQGVAGVTDLQKTTKLIQKTKDTEKRTAKTTNRKLRNLQKMSWNCKNHTKPNI